MSPTRVVAIAGYALVLVIGVAVEAAARRPGSRVPTLGTLCGYVMRYRVGVMPVGRVAVLGFWWWLGWHLLAR